MRLDKVYDESLEMQDVYKLAIFPLMMQALYNAYVVMGSECASPPVMVDKGAVRPTFEDCKCVLSALKSVGISERFSKRDYDDCSCSLRHFNELEKADVIRDFSPDQMERDGEIDELKRTMKAREKDFVERRKELREEIDRLNKEADEQRDRMAQMGELAMAARKNLTEALQYPMSKEELRGEIAEAIRLLYGGQLKGEESKMAIVRDNPLDTEFADARKDPARGKRVKR